MAAAVAGVLSFPAVNGQGRQLHRLLPDVPGAVLTTGIGNGSTFRMIPAESS
jgi:nitrate/nitrite transporter NarK